MSTYFIASLKHTAKHHEHIIWWCANHCGYTPVLGQEAGRYCYGEACDLNDGRAFVAVPGAVVEGLISPEPYRSPAQRFYDQRGPVVCNTLENWGVLLAQRLLPEGMQFPPKPSVFRGRRHGVCIEAGLPTAGQTPSNQT